MPKLKPIQFALDSESLKVYEKWKANCDKKGLIYKKRIIQLMLEDLKGDSKE